MVQALKSYSVAVPVETYKRLHALSLAHQHTPAELLTIAVNLLALTLPRTAQIKPKLFQPAPRRSAQGPKP